MQGMNRDGHNYIKKAWMAGVRCFLIQHEVAESEFSESTFIHTSNALDSLQVLAAKKFHRLLLQGLSERVTLKPDTIGIRPL